MSGQEDDKVGYQALYRKWRPRDFDALVGQEHISRTLQNAVRKERIAHAYLFAGPRGTGKTSMARILAKAVNCLSPQDGQPCNACVNCENISDGKSMDIMEIDAASNRGIDEIREIRERVAFVPSQGRYKVYIIDEVHMLTMEAFNALLKTLEDPPVHVIFILATTDAARIPATIISRCQRFDFRRIGPAVMEKKLAEIMADCGVTAEEGALPLIVKKAEGGLRDAISYLDQCISYSPGTITTQTVYEVLGLVKSEALLALSEAVVKRDAAGLFTQLNGLLRGGLEPGQILRDFVEHLRNMTLLLLCGPDTELVVATDEEKKQLLQQGKQLGIPRLSRYIALLSKADSDSRWRQNMRIVLETSLVGLIYLEETDLSPRQEQARPLRQEPAKAAQQEPTGSTQQELTQTAQQKPDKPPRQEKGRQAKQTKQITPEQPEVGAEGLSLATVREKWPLVMDCVKDRKRMVHALMTDCEPAEISGNTLVLVFKSGYTFHKENIESAENKKLIEDVLAKNLGRALNIVCRMEEQAGPGGDDPVQKARDMFGPGIVIIKD